MENEELKVITTEDDYIKDINRLIRFKCKPVYNFQSIEFEYECDLAHIDAMLDLYKIILDGLMVNAPEQPAKQIERPIKKPAVEMPSEKMYKVMDLYGIKYTSKTTKEEAQKLIQASVTAKANGSN